MQRQRRSNPPKPGGDRHLLAGIGLDQAEEVVFTELVGKPGVTAEALAGTVGLTGAAARRALARLEAEGLISRTPGRPIRYVPAPPDSAIEVLVLRHQEQLETARVAAKSLAETFRASLQRSTPAQQLEIVTGRDAVAQRLTQLHLVARKEIVGFDKPPYTLDPSPDGFTLTRDSLARGVHCRILYESESLEFEAGLESMEANLAAGEEARLVPSLPIKMAIMDGDAAIIPLEATERSIDSALIIHAPAIISALSALFENLWRDGLPLVGALATEKRVAQRGSIDERQLLTLLAAGATDEAIARQFGVSLRTVARHIQRLFEPLGARTRFQAGLFLAKTQNEDSEV